MAVFLGDPFSSSWKGKPPGMAPRDAEIWKRWHDKHEKDILRVFYNVRVGGGTPPDEQNSPDDVLHWLMLTMLRIDAVVETKEHVLLIEVRPEAGRSLFGALMVYKQLWAAAPPIDKPFIPLGLSNFASDQIRSLFELNGLRVEAV